MIIDYKDNNEKRLDIFLAEQNNKNLISRSFIEKLIKDNYILVNNKKVKKSYKLQKNDIICLEIPPLEKISVEPENILLEVLYQDQFLAVINKQDNIVVHPATGNLKGTILNAAMYLFEGKLSSINSDRPGIVHRIDKDTTGALILAKDNMAHYKLQELFREKKIDKYYKAIVLGDIDKDEFTIDAPIGRHKKNRLKKAVVYDGRNAVTHCKVIQRYGFFTVLDIKIETGRTHQIRVHMNHINKPILGDRLYSSLNETLNRIPVQFHSKVKFLWSNILKRQALHAYKLHFKHPILSDILDVNAPLPKDLEKTIEWLDDNFYKEE